MKNSIGSWAIQAWDEFKKTNSNTETEEVLNFNLNDAVELYNSMENKEIALLEIESLMILQFGYTLKDGQNDQSILKNVMALQAFINMKEEQQEPFDVDQYMKNFDAALLAALKDETVDLELEDEEAL